MTERIWRILSSLRVTALLGIAIALYVGIAAFIPQGTRAFELLSLDSSATLRRLAAFGLTDVFNSAWLRVLGIFFAGNVLAVLVAAFWDRGKKKDELAMPNSARHQVELKAVLPERSVEALRETYRAALGSAPIDEQVDGSRVVLVFETNTVGRLAPLFAHLGLVLMVVGAGFASQPPAVGRNMVRAQLKVQDSQTGAIGFFDMGQGEKLKFFQWPSTYVLQSYLPAKGNLGPAVQITETDPQSRRPPSDFWIYLHAPPGFDQRHRRGSVAIEAVSMGLMPMPGAGMASSPAMVLVLVGLGLLVIGAVSGSRSEGRLWVEADGDRVRILGLPAFRGDAAFESAFGRYALLAKAAVEG